MRRNIDPSYGVSSWETLREAIKLIYARGDTMSLSYEELYRIGYNMSQYNFGEILHNGLQEVIKEHLGVVYERINSAPQATFLQQMKSEWDSFNISRSQVQDILMYFDRSYPVKRRKMTSGSLTMALFRDMIICDSEVGERLVKILLDQIENERNGESIDWFVVSAMTRLLVELGADSQGRSVYGHYFEKRLLEATTEYYRKESKLYVSEGTLSEYMIRVERRINEEVDRVERYLDRCTLSQLKWITETELLLRNQEKILYMPTTGFRWMLRNDKYEDIHRTYRLLSRVENGQKMVLSQLRTEVVDRGMEIVENQEYASEFQPMINAFLALKAKYDKVVADPKSGDKTADKTLLFPVNEAFEHFLNAFEGTPEFLSLYIDKLLRQEFKGLSEDEIEQHLDSLIALFRYLQNKDVFQKYYSLHLSKRLLYGRSVSEDAEKYFAIKLKEECGSEYTRKVEGMFNDMKTSEETNAAFKNSLTEAEKQALPCSLDLNVSVLKIGVWPVSEVASNGLPILPHDVTEHLKLFISKYNEGHDGRILKVQNSLGTAELRAKFSKSEHELVVSTWQMCVLMNFNDQDSLTYKELQEATGISEQVLCRTLQSLACAKYKILLKEPRGRDVGETDVFSFNAAFTNRGFRIRVPTISSSKENDKEREDAKARVEQDRKPQIEAAIVRIMKDRKTLDHSQLIAEVVRQLSPKFRPEVPDIKLRIESLIDREFLARDNERTYKYRA
ncbi:hypothetical protein NDN08_000229 [Rhodosorus marinus]|uniref:Cullin family profile domain-containing protein n=1 Tax=Rhodosorus marinus TaxID=101924 RepID=A0AAV8UHJ7_9RHOD|nr:hypothetical protein NDN08_000229 [Rhodosorus marinus]